MSEGKQRELTSAIRFGDYELDPRRGVLSRLGVPLKLQPQPFRVLELLVARAPDIVTREELTDYVWGSGVYVDIDQSLNFCIRQIRSVLNETASNPSFVDTLPKQGYRFIGTVLHESQSPPSLPPAAPPEHPVPSSVRSPSAPQRQIFALPVHSAATSHPEAIGNLQKSGTDAMYRRFWVAVLACALLLSGFFAVRSLRNHPPNPAPRITSLAVLPLDNLSSDRAQDYFADGMTDELITMLAKSSTLRIVSRTSVMQYKGVHRPIRDIARELGVDGVLEGSVVHSGDKVHMTIQLIQAPSDTHLWAESYDRDAREAVALPGEAAEAIAKRLNSAVPQVASSRIVLPDAHDAYLRGRYLWVMDANEKSGPYFRKAIELQPDYALAWSGLANYYGAGAIEGKLRPEESLPQEEEAARKAVALDDSLAEAHLSLGAAIFLAKWDWAQADKEISRAIQLNPRYAEPYHFRSKMYTALNRDAEAIAAEKKSTDLDQFARPFAMALAYFSVRQYDSAIEDAQLRLQVLPQDITLHWVLGEAYRRKGAEEKAERELENVLRLSGQESAAASVRQAFEHGGTKAVLGRRLQDLRAQSSERYMSPVDLATITAQLGRREETLSYLEEAYRQRSPLLLWVQNDPAFDFLRSDERFRSILRRVGLPLRN